MTVDGQVLGHLVLRSCAMRATRGVRGSRGPRINGVALQALRRARQESLVDVSVRSGVDHSYISRLERGERRYPAIRITSALAQALDVPVEALLAAEVIGVAK